MHSEYYIKMKIVFRVWLHNWMMMLICVVNFDFLKPRKKWNSTCSHINKHPVVCERTCVILWNDLTINKRRKKKSRNTFCVFTKADKNMHFVLWRACYRYLPQFFDDFIEIMRLITIFWRYYIIRNDCGIETYSTCIHVDRIIKQAQLTIGFENRSFEIIFLILLHILSVPPKSFPCIILSALVFTTFMNVWICSFYCCCPLVYSN